MEKYNELILKALNSPHITKDLYFEFELEGYRYVDGSFHLTFDFEGAKIEGGKLLGCSFKINEFKILGGQISAVSDEFSEYLQEKAKDDESVFAKVIVASGEDVIELESYDNDQADEIFKALYGETIEERLNQKAKEFVLSDNFGGVLVNIEKDEFLHGYLEYVLSYIEFELKEKIEDFEDLKSYIKGLLESIYLNNKLENEIKSRYKEIFS